MNTENNEGRFIGVDDVTAMLGLSRKTVYSMIQRGYLPGFKVGGRVLVDRIELEARIAELKQESTRQQSAPREGAVRGK